MTDTFGLRVMAYYDNLERFRWVTPEVAILSPIADDERRRAMAAFCHEFYSDNQNRVFWLGINPSRVRRTSTGVPYTDGFALQEICGIPNGFNKSRELTSDFFYRFVNAYGGPEAFYRRHYAGAAFPLSILRKEKYCNYYDRNLPDEISKSIPGMVARQAEIGHAGVLVIVGSGQNAKILKRINDKLGIFSDVLVVEHPRYVMQYKSAELERYLEKFCETAREAERIAGL